MKGATFSNEGTGEFWKFQSTLPVKGATIIIVLVVFTGIFQSTLPVKGATAMLTNFSVTIVQLSANSTNFSL